MTLSQQNNLQSANTDLAPGISLWGRQLSAIIRIEIGKSLFSRSSIVAYGLISIPILLIVVWGLAQDNWDTRDHDIEQARRIYSYIYAGLILGAVVFFGCASIFTTLFRGEMLNSSIHYYLLIPVRRSILVFGKYLAGLFSAFILFGTTTVVCYLLLYVPYGVTQLIADLTNSVAIPQMLNYLGITFLASLGYGALFMMTGLLFRNPLLPVGVVALWEIFHFMLPPALKVFSIIHYLKGLMPIPLDDGPFAIIVTPPALWVSMAGITGLAAFAIAVAVFVLRRFEVRYTED